MATESDAIFEGLPVGLPDLSNAHPIDEVLEDWLIDSVVSRDLEFTYVHDTTPVNHVKTLMIVRDFSQIPVLSKDRRDVKGTVTWKSLAGFRADGRRTAGDVMHSGPSRSAKLSDRLLEHIADIIEDDFIYVRGDEGEFVSIVTTTDLAKSFHDTSGPFMRLREVELRIRDLIDRLKLSTIRSGLKRAGNAQRIKSANDLMFGQYVELFEIDDNWEAIGLPFDRELITENLRAVNKVRNDVMHFRPEPLSTQQSHVIDWCLNWLRECSDRDATSSAARPRSKESAATR